MGRLLMLVGGTNHGTFVEIGDAAKTYVELASGTVYIVREVASEDPTLDPGQVRVQELLMHEGLVPGGPQAEQGAIVDAVMGNWFRQGAIRDLPEQDSSPQATRERAASAGLFLP